MPGAVKRSYRSPRREAQALQTRRDVLAAARRLFVAGGYGATTLQEVASAAGVAVQTIYASFGSKRRLLEEVLDVAIAGDDAPVAVNDREWMRTVFEDPDPGVRLTAYATAVVGIHARAGDVFAVLRAAADSDPEVAELAAVADGRRRRGATSIVSALEAIGGLRAGLGREEAIDLLWTLNSADLFRLLVRDSGWTLERYEAWLGETMRAQLLGG